MLPTFKTKPNSTHYTVQWTPSPLIPSPQHSTTLTTLLVSNQTCTTLIIPFLHTTADHLTAFLRTNTPTFPAVDTHTRVIAVFGPTSINNSNKNDNESHFADFQLLHNCLGGDRKRSYWIAADPIPDTSFITHHHQAKKLKLAFLDRVLREASKAKPGERIIVVLVGFGSKGGLMNIGDGEMVGWVEVEAY
ncbi:hypothetical protein EX30DRAFT_360935 [Ascodesmis nigricans]|uniref:Uncharacterized protein n=1 Tax=Ascodesmis nigricans TaxID=341454 RepID=A0A4V3SJR1_9PEZI|nr:hypothetical protein EX30DRAFT_360935 [Ascodesmis nigricans]